MIRRHSQSIIGPMHIYQHILSFTNMNVINCPPIFRGQKSSQSHLPLPAGHNRHDVQRPRSPAIGPGHGRLSRRIGVGCQDVQRSGGVAECRGWWSSGLHLRNGSGCFSGIFGEVAREDPKMRFLEPRRAQKTICRTVDWMRMCFHGRWDRNIRKGWV